MQPENQNVANIATQEQFLANFETDIGIREYGLSGTLSAAYNAVTQYIDHPSSYRLSDNRLVKRIWFGEGELIKKRLIERRGVAKGGVATKSSSTRTRQRLGAEMNKLNTIETKMKDWQSLAQAQMMIEDVIAEINKNPVLRKRARLMDRGYPFKELFDEYVPLVDFASLYCDNGAAEVRYTGKETQTEALKYDGEIKTNKETILTIEIVKPFDGKGNHRNAEQINENGFSEVEIYDSFKHIETIAEKIIDTAKNKARKDYHNSILVIYPPDINWYKDLDDELDKSIYLKTIGSLKEITFNAKEVYLLIPRYTSKSRDYDGELIRIS